MSGVSGVSAVDGLVRLVLDTPDVSTATVSDALDVLGIEGCVPGLRSMSGRRAAGPAFTVLFEPVPDGAPAPAADYVDDVPAGAVVVLANGGRTDCTVWGGLLSAVAAQRGIAATVVDGACRDVDDTVEAGHQVWAVAAYMRSGKNRARMAAVQQPVVVGGVPVAPGDVVVADGNGVVVVPAARAADVAAAVERVAAVERAVLAAVQEGAGLADARARHGYHAVAVTRPAPSPPAG